MPQPRRNQSRRAAGRTQNGGPTKRYSAPQVRKAIVQALAPDKEMTRKQLQAATAQLLPSADRASISSQIDVLEEKGDVAGTPGKTGKLSLTESGQRWWRGIKVLSSEPIQMEEARRRRSAS